MTIGSAREDETPKNDEEELLDRRDSLGIEMTVQVQLDGAYSKSASESVQISKAASGESGLVS